MSILVDRPVYVSSVMLNDVAGRAASAIDPGGGGVQSIKATFSKAVTFAPEDVLVEAVTFNGNSETVTATLSPSSLAGCGTSAMTIGFDRGSVVDTWVKVTLKGSGTLQGAAGYRFRLDGEPRAAGTGRTYLYAASDLPTGNGIEGGDAIFYVGSLRGDFASVGGAPTPDGQVADDDVAAFAAKYQAADKDADFRGVGFAAGGPDGQVVSCRSTRRRWRRAGGWPRFRPPGRWAPASPGRWRRASLSRSSRPSALALGLKERLSTALWPWTDTQRRRARRWTFWRRPLRWPRPMRPCHRPPARRRPMPRGPPHRPRLYCLCPMGRGPSLWWERRRMCRWRQQPPRRMPRLRPTRLSHPMAGSWTSWRCLPSMCPWQPERREARRYGPFLRRV
ncbi:MAG: hypothetical protein NTU94_13110 [Planctomycetota bacterium]|nr:hypothetical protein [Planctomycetota bacterium]